MPYSFRQHLFFLLLMLVVLLTPARAQKGFQPLKATTDLQTQLAKAAAATQTISSDFTQIKHMSMLQDKVTSKGNFFYKQNDKIRIVYKTPFSYLLVMNGNQIIVKEGSKTNKINTQNSKTMQSVNKVMMDCMRGSVFQNKDFKVAAFGSGDQYLLTLTPTIPSMKILFEKINVYISKRDYSVQQLSMHESGGDYTDMIFSNKKTNISLADTLFSIR